MTRYVAVQEPTCTWAVFDTLNDLPAEFDGVTLIGLEEAEALELAASANDQCSDRLREALALGRLRLVATKAA
ncbi:MAG: hypothetical protein JNK47_02760 [Mesorhizobium sp.]|nr:hypothetical protein [Mesorhizobium sp.]MBL8576122.1 hypothetical protein [Mesorhizobium sp.]